MNFDQLISPCSIEDFFNDYWEKKALIIKRETPEFYEKEVSVLDIEDLFYNQNLSPVTYKFSKNEVAPNQNSWTKAFQFEQQASNNVNQEKVFGLLQHGYSLVISFFEKVLPKFARFCQKLENEFLFKIKSYLIITPANSKEAFLPHSDTHGVFVLQISGRKKWHLYDIPIESPSKYIKYSNEHYKDIEPAEVFELNPGDLLYIPKGLVHQAFPTDVTSMHISVTLASDIGSSLIRILSQIAEKKAFFRKYTPNGFSTEEEKNIYSKKFKDELISLINETDTDELLSSAHENFIINQSPNFRNRFRNLDQTQKLNLNSVVSRRENILYKTYKKDKRFCLIFEGKKIEFHYIFEKCFETILREELFKIKEIEGLINDEGKIKLIQQLIDINFLKIM